MVQEIETPRSKLNERLVEKLKERGFDKTRISSDGYVAVKCSQCEALFINSVACHENGCPNKR